MSFACRSYVQGDSMLVIFSGLPGTGKSTLCHALAAYAPSAVLNKDVIRQAVFGAAHTDYSRQQDDLCGSMMLAAAEYLLRKNRPLHVYLDGRTFSRKYQLRAAIELAERLAVPWRILHCACSDEVAKRRLKRAGNHLARNRDYRLYKRIQANFEPIAFEHLTINTDLPLRASLAQAAAYLGLAFPPDSETATPE
ncbi:MAG: ATP-binding protein [Candidatus Korobacteraceae bacterium]|jgi:adenylylsulfate kinase